MAVAERSKSTVAGSSTTTFAPAKPSGMAAGDLLLAFLYMDGTPVLTRPTGFTNRIDVNSTNVSPNPRLVIDWKIADGSEGATLSWSWTGSAFREGTLVAISGPHQTTPILSSTSSNNSNAAANDPPNLSLDTTGTDACLVYLAGTQEGGNGSAWSQPATWNLTWNSADDIGVGNKVITPAGSTGNVAMAWAGAGTGAVLAAILAVQPPAAAAGVFTRNLLIRQAVNRAGTY